MKGQPKFEVDKALLDEEYGLKLVMPNPLLPPWAESFYVSSGKKEMADGVALIFTLTSTTTDKQTVDRFCDLLNKRWEIKPRKEKPKR